MNDIHEKVAATGRKNIERLIETRPSTLEDARDYLSEVVPILTFIAGRREFATDEDGTVRFDHGRDPKYSHSDDKNGRISYLESLKRLCTIVGDLEARYWDDLSEEELSSRDAAIVANLRRAIYLAIDWQQKDITIDDYHPVYGRLCDAGVLGFDPSNADQPFVVTATYKELREAMKRGPQMPMQDFVTPVRRQTGKPLKVSDIDKC